MAVTPDAAAPRPTGTHGATVELVDVSMYYGDRQVTDAISLDLRPGEVLSIVGPSGCGKTTLLRAIGGLNAPGDGVVRVDGREVGGRTPDGVSVVFQQFGLFPWKTVLQNVAYAATVSGTSRREATDNARHWIRLVGLEGFEDSYPHQLSGGMQQRTGLARALSTRPRVLLMDEPFGALDAQTREVLQFELLDILQADRVTTVFVTHAIEEAVLFGHRIAVLRGRPSTVVDLVEVDLPAPRDRAVLRTPEFADLREHVWSQVMAAG